MGTDLRIAKMESIQSVAKGPGLGAIVILAGALVLTGCSSQPKVTSDLPPLPQVSPSSSVVDWSKALTTSGFNFRPRFSKQGKTLLFLSRNRSAHRNSQLYEFNLEQRTERRLTFQDGEVIEAVSGPTDSVIFYASTTDELKDRPPLFFPQVKSEVFPTSEVYKMVQGEELHERWTQRPGFDGFLHSFEDEDQRSYVVISRWAGGDLELARSPVQKSNFSKWQKKNSGEWHHSFASRPGKPDRAWVLENGITGASKIIWQAKGGALETKATPYFEIRDLVFAPASSSETDFDLLFTARRLKTGPRAAFRLVWKNDCSHLLLSQGTEVGSLHLSPDQGTLVWSWIDQKQSQVFLGPLENPQGPCEPLVPAAIQSPRENGATSAPSAGP